MIKDLLAWILCGRQKPYLLVKAKEGLFKAALPAVASHMLRWAHLHSTSLSLPSCGSGSNCALPLWGRNNLWELLICIQSHISLQVDGDDRHGSHPTVRVIALEQDELAGSETMVLVLGVVREFAWDDAPNSVTHLYLRRDWTVDGINDQTYCLFSIVNSHVLYFSIKPVNSSFFQTINALVSFIGI